MIMELTMHVQYVASLAEHWQRTGQRDYLTKTLYERARGSVVAVSFVTPPKALVGLVCRNFYTASLRLVQYNLDGSVSVLLDNHSLMQYTNCEDDAQKWHVIYLDKLPTKPDVSRLEALWLYLFQPSTLFDKWELQHLKFYESRVPVVPSASLSPHGTREAALVDDTKSPLPLLPPVTESATLSRRLSRSSLLAVDAKDVREQSNNVLALLHQLRQTLRPLNQ